MQIHSLQFKGFSCFKDDWSSVPLLKPFCVIIGKNNTGKSHYLQLIEHLFTKELPEIDDTHFISKAILDEDSLKGVFLPGRRSSTLDTRYHGDNWQSHGQHYLNIEAAFDSSQYEHPLTFQDDFDRSFGDFTIEAEKHREKLVKDLFTDAKHTLYGRIFRQLLADRDIQPEPAHNTLTLKSDGSGATNIIRRFLYSTDNIKFPRELIRNNMLEALNTIFGDDGHFTEISAQHIDGAEDNKPQDLWEIYLGQKNKGLIALSKSGSSLKTVFLVLLNLIVIPNIENKRDNKEYVYAFEELENNLHPALLRRLLSYLESHTRMKVPHLTHSHPIFFLTTHSNVSLDYFAGQEHAQIIHITHNGKSAKATEITQNREQLDIIRELGSKPSDLLQANGVIWVEGPSDRFYLNKWIELWSDGGLEEGRHYQIMFYGGGLIANLGATYSDEKVDDLINLLTINSNVIVVTDSDKKSSHAHLKPRAKRIKEEFKKLNPSHTFHWLLKAREIENYLTGNLINYTLTKKVNNLKDPDQFESFFQKQEEKNYLSRIKRKSYDKSALARETTLHMTKENLANRFDLDESMLKIVRLIQTWNE